MNFTTFFMVFASFWVNLFSYKDKIVLSFFQQATVLSVDKIASFWKLKKWSRLFWKHGVEFNVGVPMRVGNLC